MRKIFLVVSWLLISTSGIGQIREIPVYTLPDIAVASMDQLGPVIYFNPLVCEEAGPLVTAFFQAHEYGHHNLGHITGILTGNPYLQSWLSLHMENDADAYSVRFWVNQGRKDILQASANYLWHANNNGDRTHSPSRVRATNIVNYYRALTNSPLFD
jgi:hypothetical protein